MLTNSPLTLSTLVDSDNAASTSGMYSKVWVDVTTSQELSSKSI